MRAFWFSLALVTLAACSTPPVTTGPCEGVTCSGQGTCVEQSGLAQCVCQPGFNAVGLTCTAVAVNPCADQACSGHGTCQVSSGAGACVCANGYHADGLSCVQDLDPCAGVTCSGRGTCQLSGGAPQCVCQAGSFPQGLNCELSDPCLGITCQSYEQCNGGTCGLRPGACRTQAECTLPQVCDTTHTCTDPANPCAGVTCSSHGTCTPANGSATCTCDSGFAANGLSCVSVATPCDGVTCSGHGACQVSGGQAVCLCAANYLADGLNCVLSPCTGVTCSGHGTCAVSGTTAACTCGAGYHADLLTCVPDATACTGITCSGHGTCSIVGGAAQCACDVGFDPMGTTCVQPVVAGDLFITELMADPSITTDALGEWLEVVNRTSRTLSLATLVVRVGTVNTTVGTAGLTLAPGAHLVVARSIDARVPFTLTATFSNLANAGGTVAVLVGGVVISQVTYPATQAGRAFQLGAANYASATAGDFANWCVATTVISATNTDLGTPGSQNPACGAVVDAGTVDAGTVDAGTIDAGTIDAGTIDAGVDAGTNPCLGVTCTNGVCSATSGAAVCVCNAGYHLELGACVLNAPPSTLVISEYLAAPSVIPDLQGEWVELYNAGTTPATLTGLELMMDTTAYPLGLTGTLAAGARVVVARSPVAPLPTLATVANMSMPNTGAHTLGLRLAGVAVGTPVTLVAHDGLAWQLDAQGTWCDARSLIGPGNADRGTPGSPNVACTAPAACEDVDADGHLAFDATLCPAGDDRCDTDPAAFTLAACTTCVDGATRPGAERCGLTLQQRFVERCIEGRWLPTATCPETAVCIEGQERTVACAGPALGTRTEFCTNGAWDTSGTCAADECGTVVHTGDVTVASVADLAPLIGVTAISGHLRIFQSDRVNLSQLASLRCVQTLTIGSNTGLQSLTGLGSLVRVTGALSLSYNGALTSLSALSALRSVGQLTIASNNTLGDVSLPALTGVSGDVSISSSPALTSLTGLGALRRVGGNFDLINDDALQTIDTGGRLRTVGRLMVKDSDDLRSLGVPGLAAVQGSLNVDNNDHVYFDLPGGPHLTFVQGDLSVTNHFGLGSMTDAFRGLRHLGGSLIISGNNGLTDWAAFPRLLAIGGGFPLSNTAISFDVVLPKVEVIEGSVTFTVCGFHYMSSLAPRLARIGGSLVLNTAAGDSWAQMPALRHIGVDLLVTDTANFQTMAMPALETVGRHARFQRLGGVTSSLVYDSFVGFGVLRHVGGDFELTSIDNIRSLLGFQNLARVEGSVNISYDSRLTSAASLMALRWVGGTLRIEAGVTSWRPLLGLTHVGPTLILASGAAPYCEAVLVKDHLILDTGWAGTATLSGNTMLTCP